jgi:glycosyltransferase involved in cell wall biosynthesis
MKLGAAQSRNLAVARAKGDVLMHLDADDVLLQGALEIILPLYNDVTISWVAVRVDDLVNSNVVTKPHELTGIIEPGVVSARWLSNGHLPFHSVAFTMRRGTFLEAGCYPALIAAEDVGLVLAVTDRYRGVVLKDTLAQYRKWSLQTNVASVAYTDFRPLCVQLLTDAVRARQSSKT